MSFDPETFGRQMSAIVRDTVSRELNPLLDRIGVLERRLVEVEAREPVAGARGEPGIPGRGISNAMVRAGDGVLILTLSDGETLEVGPVQGSAGRDGIDGRDGRDVDPEVVRSLVNEAVAQIPPPERGERGEQGLQGERGRDGTSVTLDEVIPMVQSEVERQISQLPPPEPGAPGLDGRDGRDIDPADIREMVRAAVSEIPEPEPGPPGRDGQDGRDGASVTIDDVAPLIEDAVSRAVANIPTPENGKDGRDGIDGKDGRGVADLLIENTGELVATFTDGSTKRLGRIVGSDGRDGLDGSQGRGLQRAVVGDDGNLRLVFDDATEIDVGRVRGTDGKDGQDGRDGRDGENGTDGRDGIDGKDGKSLTLDDFDLNLMEDGRTLLFTFEKDAAQHSFEICFPVVLDRGAWKEKAYDRGDSVSWAGSTWIAQRDVTAEEKPGTSDAWRLSVKRGRDGKQGAPGRDGRDYGEVI